MVEKKTKQACKEVMTMIEGMEVRHDWFVQVRLISTYPMDKPHALGPPKSRDWTWIKKHA